MATFKCAESADDVCRYGANTFDKTNIVVYLGYAGIATKGGFRFPNVTIPLNSIILTAKITFQAYGTQTTSINTLIKGEANNNPATFSTYTDFDGRTRTSANVAWIENSAWNSNTDYSTPDISPIIQEIIKLPGWASGNAIAIFIEDNGSASYKQPKSYDTDTANCARLIITYNTIYYGSPKSSALKSQQFTATGNFAVPANVTCVWVTLVGGGGGGGGGGTAVDAMMTGGGGGGGAESFVSFPIPVSPGNIVVTIGAGGAGGAGNNVQYGAGNNGNAGENSNFGSYLTAVGGKGGQRGGYTVEATYGVGGNGGGVQGGGGGNSSYLGNGNPGNVGVQYWMGLVGTSGSGGGGGFGGYTYSGGNGGNMCAFRGGNGASNDAGGFQAEAAAGGGASAFGAGGSAKKGDVGYSGTGYGAGGGGGSSSYANPGSNGGNGANGYCIVEWIA
jgi:hypothetical protein